MRFCPMDKCIHYNTTTKYPQKCYYEPQCWRGAIDGLIAIYKGVQEGRDRSSHHMKE